MTKHRPPFKLTSQERASRALQGYRQARRKLRKARKLEQYNAERWHRLYTDASLRAMFHQRDRVARYQFATDRLRWLYRLLYGPLF